MGCYTIRETAPPGCHYAPDAFDANVGKTIRVAMVTDDLGMVRTHGVVVAVAVTPDLLAVDITLEVATWN